MGEWTKGVCVATVDDDGCNLRVSAGDVDIVHGCGCCNSPWTDDACAKANAALIAEAFNVANETGLTPRQLADRNKELVEALEALVFQCNEMAISNGWPDNGPRFAAMKTLSRTKGEA